MALAYFDAREPLSLLVRVLGFKPEFMHRASKIGPSPLLSIPTNSRSLAVGIWLLAMRAVIVPVTL